MPEAAIWERPSASSRVACTVPEGTQLLIAAPDGPWCRVMMAEGPACYVTKEDVRLTGVRISRDVAEPEPEGRLDVVAEAQLHLGTPYVWGGGSRRGADCSGFVRMVFARCGTTLPRAARAQAGVGRA
ncbi:MAG: C40 family peptidase, partial [Armatimonadota bacterium]